MTDITLVIQGLKLESLNKAIVNASMGARLGMAARAKEQRWMACAALHGQFGKPPSPPLTITITRVGPRDLDSDNLAASAKHFRDGVADWLGVNDRSKELQWLYAQEKTGKGQYGVKIHITTWCR
jgi:hypothetical protein